MLIDWFTVGAQILNFLVLVYLLKRFLYGPIVKAMEEREKKIALSLDEAERRREEAEKETESYREKKRALEEGRQRILNEAKKEAEWTKKDLISNARDEVESLRSQWQESFHDEIETFLHDLRMRVGRQVCDVARKALSDISTAELEGQIAAVFMKKIENMDKKDMERIWSSINDGQHSVVVSSAFELPAQNREEVTRAIHTRMGGDTKVTYRTDPDLLCGIEMRVNGHVVGWNLHEYLKTFSEDFRKALESTMVGVPGNDEEAETKQVPSDEETEDAEEPVQQKKAEEDRDAKAEQED